MLPRGVLATSSTPAEESMTTGVGVSILPVLTDLCQRVRRSNSGVERFPLLDAVEPGEEQLGGYLDLRIGDDYCGVMLEVVGVASHQHDLTSVKLDTAEVVKGRP